MKLDRRLSLLPVLLLVGCGQPDAETEVSDAASVNDSAQFITRNLAKFDTLDFDVFSNQQWERLKDSHAANIIVTWPDGHETHGIDKHIEDLKAMFVYAPDTQIKEHPIRIANGNWSAVTGVMTGTFSRPMPLPDGKTIPPTGKKFRLTMATIGHWTEDGVMDREWLFWDNQAFMKQIGLAQ
jgi:predicted ester cyclase